MIICYSNILTFLEFLNRICCWVKDALEFYYCWGKGQQPLCIGRVLLKRVSHAKREKTLLEVNLSQIQPLWCICWTFMMCMLDSPNLLMKFFLMKKSNNCLASAITTLLSVTLSRAWKSAKCKSKVGPLWSFRRQEKWITPLWSHSGQWIKGSYTSIWSLCKIMKKESCLLVVVVDNVARGNRSEVWVDASVGE